MINKGKLLKLFASLGIKGILCLICLLICLASVSFALVTYTSTVAITPTVQLSVGTTTASWTIYVNEVNQVQYMPGGASETTLNTGDTSTYAFKVVTDANKVCAVKVELTTAMDPSKFSNFDITVLSNSTAGGSWGAETLYTGSTGTSTTLSIDGLTQGAAAYIHQGISTTKYYEIQVTYSYDKVDDTTPITATFQFTPFPQNGF
jgi:hypothetical protein